MKTLTKDDYQSSIGITKYNLIAFDLDGTLIEGYMDREDKDYSHVALLPNVQIMLSMLHTARTRLAVVTNQGGVGLGYNDVGDFLQKVKKVEYHLDMPNDCEVDLFVCFAHEKRPVPRSFKGARQWDVTRRKPSGAMLRDAQVKAKVETDSTLYVGDMASDEACAQDAGCDFTWARDFFLWDDGVNA